MKTVVCCKRVPATTTRIKITSDAKGIDEEGIQFTLNPYDELAVEEAIRLKEAEKASETIALTLGPDGSKKALRDTLAMGIDRAILVKDEASWRDPLSTVAALADAITAEGDVGLVLCGRQAVDDQSLAVGPLLATRLGMPCVMDVVSLEVADGTATVRREAEGCAEIIEVTLPAVFTTQRGLNDPRRTSLKGIMKAKKKPLDERTFEFEASHASLEKLQPPPQRQAGKVVGEGPEAVPELVRLLRDEAKAL